MRTGETELSRGDLLSATWRDSVSAARSEVFQYLPAWMYLVYGCLLLNCELTNFAPARVDLAHTVMFPLAVFIGFYAVRSFRARDGKYRHLMIAAGLAFGLPLMALAYHSPSPVTGAALLHWYELSNFAWAGLLVWHAWKTQRTHVALFFGVGLVYGAILENGGIVLGFFHENNLQDTMVRPFVAPVATMIGWCVVLYMATFVVWNLRTWMPSLKKSHLLSAILVGALATMLDLQIDPIATAAGCWVWHQSLPGWFHGVPLVNFVAWMCALSPFAYVMFRVQEKLGIRDGAPWTWGQMRTLTYAIVPSLTLALIVFMTATLLIEGAEGASWTILYAFGSKVGAMFGV